MNPLDIAIPVSFTLVMLSFIFTFVRLLKGPSLPDRVISLDLISSIAIAITVIFAVHYNESVFMDVAVITALISFLGTVGFARYLEKMVMK